MTTVINTPGQGNSNDSGAGLVIGIIIALVLIALFFIYGLPALREQPEADTKPSTTINVELPTGGTTNE